MEESLCGVEGEGWRGLVLVRRTKDQRESLEIEMAQWNDSRKGEFGVGGLDERLFQQLPFTNGLRNKAQIRLFFKLFPILSNFFKLDSLRASK